MEKAGIAMDTGISGSVRQKVAEGLKQLLADTYVLYFKTHVYHWNITGKMFQPLHDVFEQQYTELWRAVDVVAERIRALDVPAPASYRELTELTHVREKEGAISSEEMVKDLVRGHQAVIKTARSLFPVAEAAGDPVTVDLLTQRLQVHEKTSWMLRSFLK